MARPPAIRMSDRPQPCHSREAKTQGTSSQSSPSIPSSQAFLSLSPNTSEKNGRREKILLGREPREVMFIPWVSSILGRSVTVIVAAKDKENVVGATLEGVAALQYPRDLRRPPRLRTGDVEGREQLLDEPQREHDTTEYGAPGIGPPGTPAIPGP